MEEVHNVTGKKREREREVVDDGNKTKINYVRKLLLFKLINNRQTDRRPDGRTRRASECLIILLLNKIATELE